MLYGLVGLGVAGDNLQPGNPYDPTPPHSQQPPVANLQVTPVYNRSKSCAGATVVAGPGSDPTVDRTTVVCTP